MIDTDKYEGLTIDDWYKMNHHDWKDVVNEHNDLLAEVKRLNRIETMLKENGMWVSQEGWEESDKDDELIVSVDYLIQGFQELRGDFND